MAEGNRSDHGEAQRGRASRRHLAVAGESRVTGGISGVLRSAVAGVASPRTGERDRTTGCMSVGIRGLSTWPEAQATLAGRWPAGRRPASAGPDEGLGDAPQEPGLEEPPRSVIGQCLTVWDLAEG